MALREYLICSVRGDLKHFLVLTRHFYLRLFHNDVVSFGDQMQEKIIGAQALLAVLCGHVSNVMLFRYIFLEDQGTSWVEKCYVTTFFMLLIGFIAVFEWDVIFPDARDYVNLIPLPVKIRTLFLAKFASLFFFVSLFAVAINAIAVFTHAFYLVKWQSKSLSYGLRFMGAHLVANFAAVFFFFFFNVLVIGLLMNLLGVRLFRRLSVYIRSAFLAAYIFFLVMYLTGTTLITPSFDSFLELKAHNADFLFLFPPMWFTGLYETLLGHGDAFFRPFVPLAVLSLVATVGLFYVTMGLGYRRYLKHMAASSASRPHFRGLRSRFRAAFDAVFLPHSVQRAVFYFIDQTLRQSMFHKVRLASFLAVALGMILVLVLPQPGALSRGARPSQALLAAPLILSFFLLIGIRGVSKIPSVIEANWIFRLTEDRGKHHYFSSVRKVILFRALIPLFFLLYIFYTYLWDPVTAFYHCAYGCAASVVLMEVLFLKQQKIPFTCSYLPGQERIQLFWLAYILAFLGYVFILTDVEAALLLRPAAFLYFFGAVLVLLTGIRVYLHLFFYKEIRILYEEAPTAVMLGLQPYE
jgi:hypothetical protein